VTVVTLIQNRALLVLFFLSPILVMLPVIFYLAYTTLHPPHDCFTCFNRLQIRYSIFQLNRYELQQDREAKIGKAAVLYIDKLIEEYERAQIKSTADDPLNQPLVLKPTGDRPPSRQLAEMIK
jgi:hypothetical protein